jgi:hypothetical protein
LSVYYGSSWLRTSKISKRMQKSLVNIDHLYGDILKRIFLNCSWKLRKQLRLVCKYWNQLVCQTITRLTVDSTKIGEIKGIFPLLANFGQLYLRFHLPNSIHLNAKSPCGKLTEQVFHVDTEGIQHLERVSLIGQTITSIDLFSLQHLTNLRKLEICSTFIRNESSLFLLTRLTNLVLHRIQLRSPWAAESELNDVSKLTNVNLIFFKISSSVHLV